MGGSEFPSFQVTEKPSSQIYKLQSFWLSKFPQEGGREDQWEAWNWSCDLSANERPRKKLHPMAQTDKKTYIRTSRLYERHGPVEPSEKSPINICYIFVGSANIVCTCVFKVQGCYISSTRQFWNRINYLITLLIHNLYWCKVGDGKGLDFGKGMSWHVKGPLQRD